MLILLKSRTKQYSFYWSKSKAIHIMGSKLAAKEAVKYIIFPWFVDHAITDITEAKKSQVRLDFLFL
jgi:propionyl-CoA carboxylase alpha chain